MGGSPQLIPKSVHITIEMTVALYGLFPVKNIYWCPLLPNSNVHAGPVTHPFLLFHISGRNGFIFEQPETREGLCKNSLLKGPYQLTISLGSHVFVPRALSDLCAKLRMKVQRSLGQGIRGVRWEENPHCLPLDRLLEQ